MTKKTNKSVSKINALRAKCQPVHTAAGTFNQAVKSLSGLESKHAEVLESLGIESFESTYYCLRTNGLPITPNSLKVGRQSGCGNSRLR